MDAAKAIQIITLENHVFKLHPEKLKNIFERNDFKDRKAVIVSIAGAFRKGKSFLLNFFLKYLYAQYKSCDVSDWIGENKNDDTLIGFKSQGGPERETTGIWMWSEVFTYEYDNENKVAIVVLDTQGIFDDESTVKDCTTIFSISMMIASSQCYNVMQNIQEDDLQHLQLFTDYGRLAMAQTNETPFQNLLFIVRDWPYPKQHNFGNGEAFIDKKLSGNDRQTPEMLQLREHIKESFNNIGAFLLPHPGFIVAEGTWNGDMKEIEPRFKTYVKDLVPSLFSPDKLIVKTINGQKLRIGDLVTYLQAYVDIFNSDTLPEPRTVLTATAEASNQILHSECIKNYVDLMEKSLDTSSYLNQSDLKKKHNDAKDCSLSKFENQRKLGDDNLIALFRSRLESDIESKYKSFESINDRQRRDHIAKEEAKAKAAYEAQMRAIAEAQAKAAEQAKRYAEAKAANEARMKAAAEAKAQAAEQAKRDALAQAALDAQEKAKAEAKAQAAEQGLTNLEEKSNKLEIELKNAKKSRVFSKVLKGVAAAGTVVAGTLVAGPAGAVVGGAVAASTLADIVINKD